MRHGFWQSGLGWGLVMVGIFALMSILFAIGGEWFMAGHNCGMGAALACVILAFVIEEQ